MIYLFPLQVMSLHLGGYFEFVSFFSHNAHRLMLFTRLFLSLSLRSLTFLPFQIHLFVDTWLVAYFIDVLTYALARTTDSCSTVWYELLYGEWPFKGQPPEVILWQVGRGMKPSLNNLQASKDVKVIASSLCLLNEGCSSLLHCFLRSI